MKPQDLHYLELSEVVDLVTIVDRKKTPESHPQEMRGVTLARPGFVLNKDFGTKDKFSNYPDILLRSATVLFDKDKDVYWTFVAGINDSTETEIWVHDPESNVWAELTDPPSGFSRDNGLYPHIRWLVTDSTKKVVLIAGDNPPLSIQWHAARTRYGDTIPAGWYAELHQLIPHYVRVGGLGAANDPDVPTSPSEGEFMRWDTDFYDYGEVGGPVAQTHTVHNKSAKDGVWVTFSLEDQDGYTDSTDYFSITAVEDPLDPIPISGTKDIQVTFDPDGDAPLGQYRVWLKATGAGETIKKSLIGALINGG